MSWQRQAWWFLGMLGIGVGSGGLLAACEMLTGPTPAPVPAPPTRTPQAPLVGTSTPIPATFVPGAPLVGTWARYEDYLMIDASGGYIQVANYHGRISGPVVLDASLHFTLPGTYDACGGDDATPTLPVGVPTAVRILARYTGWLSGDTLHLVVSETNGRSQTREVPLLAPVRMNILEDPFCDSFQLLPTPAP